MHVFILNFGAIHYSSDFTRCTHSSYGRYSQLLISTTLLLRNPLKKVKLKLILYYVTGLPRGLDFNVVQDTFLSIDGVLKVHNLRIWALSMDKTALSAHLAIRKYVIPQS